MLIYTQASLVNDVLVKRPQQFEFLVVPVSKKNLTSFVMESIWKL